MAWDPLGKNAQGVEEYSGDTPMDAFGGALGKIADECATRLGRLPQTSEVVEGFAAALADPSEPLAAWRRAVANAKPSPKRQRAKTGDVLAIPYAGDGTIEVYGWVLFVPTKGAPSPGLGVCVAVLDRDVRAGDDLAEVVRSKFLLGPLHPNDAEIREGLWRVVGNVAGDFDALLPRFEATVRKGKAWAHVIHDYAGNEVPSTPENRARVCEASVGGARGVTSAVRALRGDGRWLEGFDYMLPHGARRP